MNINNTHPINQRQGMAQLQKDLQQRQSNNNNNAGSSKYHFTTRLFDKYKGPQIILDRNTIMFCDKPIPEELYKLAIEVDWIDQKRNFVFQFLKEGMNYAKAIAFLTRNGFTNPTNLVISK